MNKSKIAREIVAQAGGSSKLARQIVGEYADAETHAKMIRRISKWKHNGIPARWVLPVSRLADVPASQIDPQLYPEDAA